MCSLSWLFAVPGLSIYIIVLSIIIYTIVAYCRVPKEEKSKAQFFNILLIGIVGFSGIETVIWGLLQLIDSNDVANSMNYEQSEFQIELAFAYISLGIVQFPILYHRCCGKKDYQSHRENKLTPISTDNLQISKKLNDR